MIHHSTNNRYNPCNCIKVSQCTSNAFSFITWISLILYLKPEIGWVSLTPWLYRNIKKTWPPKWWLELTWTGKKSRCPGYPHYLCRQSKWLLWSDCSSYPKTEIQKCIIHQIRNSTRYVSYKDLKKVTADLKPIYKAATEEGALLELERLERSGVPSSHSLFALGATMSGNSQRFFSTHLRSSNSSTPPTWLKAATGNFA